MKLNLNWFNWIQIKQRSSIRAGYNNNNDNNLTAFVWRLIRGSIQRIT